MTRIVVLSLLLGVGVIGCRPDAPGDYRPSKKALGLNNRAVRALDEQKFEEALALAKEALATDPGFYKAQANQAAILQAMGRDGEAIAALEDLITKHPDYADAYIPLGILLERSGKMDEAQTYYRKGLEVHDAVLAKTPDDVEAGKNRAVALYLVREPAEALKTLRTLIEKNPTDETIVAIKGRIEGGDRSAFIGLKKQDVPQPAAPK